MQIVENNRPLAAVICGFPGGGTTMLTEILRQHPKLDSGFEGGFLLVEEAKDFLNLEPFSTTLKNSWQVSETELKRICSVDNWPAVYRRLRQKSSVIKDKSVWLFDKTPRYMIHLSKVLSKVPNVPCIVLVRDPRAVFWTRVKRSFNRKAPSGVTLQEWANIDFEEGCLAYLKHADGYQEAIEKGFSQRILLVSYESLCLNREAETKKIFDFLKLNFKSDYLFFSDGNPKYRPCRGEEVSVNYVSEYSDHLSSEICEKILAMTERYKDWWYFPEFALNH